jgi:hypothetical protein
MFLHDRTLMSSHKSQNTALLVGNSGGLGQLANITGVFAVAAVTIRRLAPPAA